MAHIDYASGQWVADDNGPPPPGAASAASIDQQAIAPTAPPEPFNIPPGPAAATPDAAPTPPPSNPTAPAGAPALPTAPAGAALPTAPQPPPPVPVPPPAPIPPAPLPVAPPDNRPGLQTREFFSPQENANLGNIDQTTAARRDLSTQAGDIGVQKATNALGEQTEVDKVREQQRQEAEAAQAEQQKAADRAKAQQVADNAEYRRLRANGLHDPEADQGFGHRLLAALAVGLGQYSAAMNHTENGAAKIIADANAQNLQLQKDKIENARQLALDSGASAEQAQRDATDKLHQLAVKQAATIDAVRDRWKTESLRLGIPEARIAANQTTLELDKASEEAKQKVYESARTKITDMTPKEAGAGKGGGGSNLAAEAKVARAIQDGKSPADVRELAASLRLKGQRTDALETQGRAAAKAGAGGAVDQKLFVRDVDGSVAGTAGTARAVPALQSDLRTNTQAVEQLKKLRDADQWTSTGPKFHDAVLALAATTTAGKTDTTTAHEKGAITNMLGMPDKDAIDSKIAQTEARIAAIKAQLNPLPDDYEPPKSLAERAKAIKSGTASAPGAPAAASAPARKAPDSVIEQAKAEVRANGPHAASARKLLDQQNITVL